MTQKLNKTERGMIVEAILADVPRPDFQGRAEKIILADMEAQMPPKVLAVWKDAGLRHYLLNGGRTYSIPNGYFLNFYAITIVAGYKITGEATEQVSQIVKEATDFNAKLDNMRGQLTAQVAGLTTRAKFLEHMPEFAKYLPEESAQTANLPAVIFDTMAQLRSMGWSTPSAQKAAA